MLNKKQITLAVSNLAISSRYNSSQVEVELSEVDLAEAIEALDQDDVLDEIGEDAAREKFGLYTEAELDEAKKEARQEGYDEGLKEGADSVREAASEP